MNEGVFIFLGQIGLLGAEILSPLSIYYLCAWIYCACYMLVVSSVVSCSFCWMVFLRIIAQAYQLIIDYFSSTPFICSVSTVRTIWRIGLTSVSRLPV